MSDVCSDNRFELIAAAKAAMLEKTNIEDSQTDMAALDSILYRCWQMGWLGGGTCSMEKLERFDGDDPAYRCSECRHENYEPEQPTYCPNCGRKAEQ